MKNIKDTIDVSGATITKIGSMTWKQVLTFFVVILIVLGAVGTMSYFIANGVASKAAKDAVQVEMEIQQFIITC